MGSLVTTRRVAVWERITTEVLRPEVFPRPLWFFVLRLPRLAVDYHSLHRTQAA